MSLYWHLPSQRASRELYRRSIESPLTDSHLYDLVLASSGDESQAELAQANFLISQSKAATSNG